MSPQLTGEWWATVIHELQAHVREESQFLESYERLVQTVPDAGMRFLVQLILDDERRHHELMQQIADTALGEVTGSAATPPPPELDAAQAREVLEPTERFLAAEREDRRRLQELAHRLRPVKDESLWCLLVELMEIDTRKHVRILEYLESRVRRAATD